MKKIFLICMTAVMLMSFTACTKKAENEVPDTTTSVAEELPEYTADTRETTVAEETEIPEETTVPEETTAVPADTTAEITTAATTAAETTAATTQKAVSSVSTFKGNGYSVKVDGSKWIDVTAYIDIISKDAEKLGQNVNITAEQIKAANDAIYFNSKNINANFNLASTQVGDTSSIDLSNTQIKNLFSQSMKQQYEKAGFQYVSDKVSKVAGKNCLIVTVKAPKSIIGGNSDAIAECYIFFVGDYQYVITYTAPMEDFNTYKSDFNEVLNSLTFSK